MSIDDIVERVSPFLRRNAAVDILDLWPGPGLLSSKINDFLKPRRHVLIEPDLKLHKSFLEPLSERCPSYKLVSTDLTALRDWKTVLTEHFPEQGPPRKEPQAALPKNNTLLVLANPPGPRSAKDHFSGARWMSVFLEECMRQAGLHSYGSVRLLASLSSQDISAILPRHISARVRPSLLAEQVALHTFEVASLVDDTRGNWGVQKQWDVLVGGTARVEKRTSNKRVTVPKGRAYPPIERAPESPLPDRKRTPYAPRIKTQQNEKYVEVFKDFNNADPENDDYEKLKKSHRRTCTLLSQENSQTYQRANLIAKQNEIDDLNKSISRRAADPNTKLWALERTATRIDNLRESMNEEISKTHFDITRALPHLMDDRRAAFHTGDFDDALLLFDRRPFQPLVIHPDEIYPREVYRTFVYFEADPNPPAVVRLNCLDHEKREVATRFFTAFTNSLQTNNLLTVPTLMELFFPNRTANSIIKAIPSLAQYASKRPKKDYESLPTTLISDLDKHPEDLQLTTKRKSTTSSAKAVQPNPITSYQENLDYDLSDVRCRILSIPTLWDLSIEYANTGSDASSVQLNRLLGGSMTSAQTREFLTDGTRKKW